MTFKNLSHSLLFLRPDSEAGLSAAQIQALTSPEAIDLFKGLVPSSKDFFSVTTKQLNKLLGGNVNRPVLNMLRGAIADQVDNLEKLNFDFEVLEYLTSEI